MSQFFSCTSDTSEPVTYCVIESMDACVTGLTGKQCREEGYKGQEGYFDTECPSGYDKIIIAESSPSNGNSSINSSSSSSVPSHSELCGIKPITKECLVGRWYLEAVEGGYSGCKPISVSELKFTKKGRFVFNGAYGGFPEAEKMGFWELADGGKGIKITFDSGNDIRGDNPVDAGIEIDNTVQLELRIKTTSFTGFLQCTEGTSAAYTEVFFWQGD